MQGPTGGFLEHLLTVETDLSSVNVELLTWEPIIEGSDTSLVSSEWAMYELAKNQDVQVSPKFNLCDRSVGAD